MINLFPKLSLFAVLLAVVGGCAAEPENKQNAGIAESIHQAAVDARQKHDYASAAKHYRNLYEKQPDDLGVLLELAKSLRYTGSANEAAKILEAKIDAFAGFAPFLIELGKAKLAAGAASDAVGYLKIATEKDAGNWEAHSAMGIAYDMLQLFDKALESYKIADRLSPNNPVILNNMAISSAQTGDVKTAIAVLKQAANAGRRNLQIRQNLALFYGIAGNFDEAEAIARMDLGEEDVRNNLAFYYLFHKNQKPAAPPAAP